MAKSNADHEKRLRAILHENATAAESSSVDESQVLRVRNLKVYFHIPRRSDAIRSQRKMMALKAQEVDTPHEEQSQSEREKFNRQRSAEEQEQQLGSRKSELIER